MISPLNYISSFLYVRGGNVAYNILHATAVSIVSSASKADNSDRAAFCGKTPCCCTAKCLYHAYFFNFLIVSIGTTSRYISLQPSLSIEHSLLLVSFPLTASSSSVQLHTSSPFFHPSLSPDHTDPPSDPWAHPSLLQRFVGHIPHQ